MFRIICETFQDFITQVVVISRITDNGKGKAIPLQAWTGPEGSKRLRLPDFKAIGTLRYKVVSPNHRPPLTPGNIPGTHFC
jgi:hypothetical protein